ncbi:hypothetical protein AC249_AIPGENE24565 [Exaiptasia diaphana]|nr:hypothetical protein AC249_AIPGENE24565 [Exaiptasia diaphana]
MNPPSPYPQSQYPWSDEENETKSSQDSMESEKNVKRCDSPKRKQEDMNEENSKENDEENNEEETLAVKKAKKNPMFGINPTGGNPSVDHSNNDDNTNGSDAASGAASGGASGDASGGASGGGDGGASGSGDGGASGSGGGDDDEDDDSISSKIRCDEDHALFCLVCFGSKDPFHYEDQVNKTICCNQNIHTSCYTQYAICKEVKSLTCPFCNQRNCCLENAVDMIDYYFKVKGLEVFKAEQCFKTLRAFFHRFGMLMTRDVDDPYNATMRDHKGLEGNEFWKGWQLKQCIICKDTVCHTNGLVLICGRKEEQPDDLCHPDSPVHIHCLVEHLLSTKERYFPIRCPHSVCSKYINDTQMRNESDKYHPIRVNNPAEFAKHVLRSEDPRACQLQGCFANILHIFCMKRMNIHYAMHMKRKKHIQTKMISRKRLEQLHNPNLKLDDNVPKEEDKMEVICGPLQFLLGHFHFSYWADKISDNFRSDAPVCYPELKFNPYRNDSDEVQPIWGFTYYDTDTDVVLDKYGDPELLISDTWLKSQFGEDLSRYVKTLKKD